MAKKYQDGEHIPLRGEGDFEVIKGTVDALAAHEALSKYYGAAYVPSLDDIEIKHCFGRWGVGRDEVGECCQMFYDYDEKGRGRFPVTLVYSHDGLPGL